MLKSPFEVDADGQTGITYLCLDSPVTNGALYHSRNRLYRCTGPAHSSAAHPCCFGVLMQTEGANLYDVFSKISRGDYQPLPADRFSPALRGLVSSLLAQDPVARPTAEQVWQQGQLILQQQAAQQEQRQQPSQVVPPPQEQQQQQRPQSDHIQRAQQQDLQQQLRRQTTSVNRRQQVSVPDPAVFNSRQVIVA